MASDSNFLTVIEELQGSELYYYRDLELWAELSDFIYNFVRETPVWKSVGSGTNPARDLSTLLLNFQEHN